MKYPFFFSAALGDTRPPYRYQEDLAALPCESRLISIPTGLGKTAAVLLAWLYNRVHLGKSGWPRRLVYCLPMRTLVEQTRAEAEKWLTAHQLLWDGQEPHQRKVGLHILMGGDATPGSFKDWDLYPEENAILIGTQDMLLSRALNRGYGMSRYRWPMHFGLLNNDCLWVMDETQLMGVGVETSAQLDGFRALWPQENPCPTWWMSATLEDSRLATVDHPTPDGGWPRLTLDPTDREAVAHRLSSMKRLHKAPLAVTKQTKPADLARLIREKHVEGQLTLVIINRVQRAQELYDALKKDKSPSQASLALVHSRFRAPDRQAHHDLLIHGTGGRIVIATQAIEAGVDVSARILITELAPWSSLVQRFGRCNRGGEFDADGAGIYWLDLLFEKDDDVAPYTLAELKDARAELEKLEGASASPNALGAIQVIPPAVIYPIIRRKDVIDLFDTTPDIAGHDLDISRYIRESDDTDVQAYWRDLSASDFKPSLDAAEPLSAELCRVAVQRFKAFLKKLNEAKDGPKAWIWDGLKESWIIATHSRAGATYLLDHRAGGYDPQLGWTGEAAKKSAQWVPVSAPNQDPNIEEQDAIARDPLTLLGHPLTLEAHTQNVLRHLRPLAAFSPKHESALLTAALWHDAGKAHADFQIMLRGAAGENAPEGFLAKSGKRGGSLPESRKHFRHELASSLAWLAHHDGEPQADLIAYVIAAHHGKVRLSIRSLPDETGDPKNAERLFARGLFDGDTLPAIPGYTETATTLSLQLMHMGADENGRPSWLARMIALRDTLGPFHLAYLETLLRAADMRASAEEAQTCINTFSKDNNHHVLAGKHPPLAQPASGSQTPSEMAGDPARRGGEHGLREGTRGGGEDSRGTRPNQATRCLETSLGILSYTELAPLLAERVATVEADLLKEAFATSRLDEAFILDLHRRIAGDLVPDSAGHWRDVPVTVGRLEPPPPFQLPMLMRDYARDLEARWPSALSDDDLLIELLAFAEGRFLTIHPFRDFNGRTIRVFLLELLRRLDLPRVQLAPQTDAGRAAYFAALEAADRLDWTPLATLWKTRLAEAQLD